jgi:mannan endo-1,4-beta-mannosidase
VSEARKYRIRLILSLINNWDSYGGKAQYVKWARDDAAAAGRLNITASDDDDFFSDQTVKVYFKNHVKVAVLFYILVNIISITTTLKFTKAMCVCAYIH